VLADGATDEAFSSLSFTDVSNIGRKPGTTESYPTSRELYVIASMPIPPREGRAPAKSARGSIKKVFIDENRFEAVDSKTNNDWTFSVAASAKILSNEQNLGLVGLKPGDNVWVAYEEKDGKLAATEVVASSKRRFVQVRGIDEPRAAGQVHRLELLEGRWFGEEGVTELPVQTTGQVPETAIQAVLGEGLARELGHDFAKPRLEVGDVFELGQGRESSSPKNWLVVGIMKSEGTTFSSELWAKRANIGELYGKQNVVSSIAIRTGSADEAQQFAEFLRKDFKDANLQTQTETEYFAKLQGTNAQFTLAIGFFTFFMAIGGMFGVMNTMFAAISQRSKDIGVLRILGYARRQILISFLMEALLIALIGGLLGCALGSLTNGWSATSLAGSGQGGFGKTIVMRLIVDGNTLAVGVLLTLFMGLFGGLLPALWAMRLRPLEAMR
jgi:ABC-type lipoprotein release transport system permease subunit